MCAEKVSRLRSLLCEEDVSITRRAALSRVLNTFWQSGFSIRQIEIDNEVVRILGQFAVMKVEHGEYFYLVLTMEVRLTPRLQEVESVSEEEQAQWLQMGLERLWGNIQRLEQSSRDLRTFYRVMRVRSLEGLFGQNARQDMRESGDFSYQYANADGPIAWYGRLETRIPFSKLTALGE